MYKGLQKLISKIINLFFPKKCQICKEISDKNICSSCLPSNNNIQQFDKDKFYLYQYNGNIKKIIHQLKFERKKNVAKLFHYLIKHEFFDKYDLIIPVPCHFMRTWKRGFFHLQELFSSMPSYNGKIVKRTKNSGVLFKKNKIEREATMRNIFKVVNPSEIKEKKVLIIDDIYTTGTTYNEIKKEIEKFSPLLTEGFFLCRT
jgi:competence protein ComFC